MPFGWSPTLYDPGGTGYVFHDASASSVFYMAPYVQCHRLGVQTEVYLNAPYTCIRQVRLMRQHYVCALTSALAFVFLRQPIKSQKVIWEGEVV